MSKLPTRKENYSERYNQLVEAAGLAEKSEVRGCMIIKPYGFAIREQIQHILDTMFKNTGHQNVYFPLLIPKSYLSAEAAHVEGFAKECAVVTHHRLTLSDEGELIVDPEAKLEEELIVRPTSETIIWKTYKNWINSYRDLPLLYNQRANVMRWEMRTRIFLRTSEFLWQEGHTAHASSEEAKKEAMMIHDIYDDFMKNYLGMYGYRGPKSPSERFAGAVDTYTIESMMQDYKALQSCTTHFLGQNFSKAFDVTYVNEENEHEHVWGSSWGISSRIMGGLIMSHSDDAGLVLPPAIVPTHIVVVPIYKDKDDLAVIEAYLSPLMEKLRGSTFVVTSEYAEIERPLRVQRDSDDQKSPGWKFAQRELKGVPLRIAVGKRDMQDNKIEVYRRDTGEKTTVSLDNAYEHLMEELYTIQDHLLDQHTTFTQQHTSTVTNWDEFKEQIEDGFVIAYWDGTEETESAIKEETKATIRCLPFDQPSEKGTCVYSGNPAEQQAIFAKAY